MAFESQVEQLVIRESRRARRLILQIVPPNRVEVVVPRGTRPQRVQAFVAENRAWISAAREEIRHQYTADRARLPTRIELRALGRTWSVDYRHESRQQAARTRRARGRPSWRAEGDTLVVHPSAAHALLRNWLIATGQRELKPWLWREAARMGAMPKRVHVRLQKTRWGSYSESGTLSLNASLLLLDSTLVRYLMIHELAHMQHLDHSRAFWRRVAEFEPDYRTLDRRLGKAWQDLPLWVYPQ
jgi:predicted metal-dependent hydrolase